MFEEKKFFVFVFVFFNITLWRLLVMLKNCIWKQLQNWKAKNVWSHDSITLQEGGDLLGHEASENGWVVHAQHLSSL